MELKKTKASLWGVEYTVTPYLVEQIWGDGKQFIKLFPMLLRPNFYVVRIDSKTDTDSDEWIDILDEIKSAIDEEFGPCCEDYNRCECSHWETWPAYFDWGGCVWRDLTEREMLKLGLRMTMKPLNGIKTHPLSDHARGKLREIAGSPLPTLALNPGVVNRLLRESLVEIVQLPSPYKKHKGATCAHLRITDAGRSTLNSFCKESEYE